MKRKRSQPLLPPFHSHTVRPHRGRNEELSYILVLRSAAELLLRLKPRLERRSLLLHLRALSEQVTRLWGVWKGGAGVDLPAESLVQRRHSRRLKSFKKSQRLEQKVELRLQV